MDLNNLASRLRAQAEASGKIELDSSVFDDEKTRAAIRSAFALPSDSNLKIGVKSSDIPDASAGGVLTISKATASVLKQTDVPVRLTFTAPNGALQAIISFEMGPSWKFNNSFKGLDDFPFNLLETSGAHFVYTTVAQSNFAWPGETSHSVDLVHRSQLSFHGHDHKAAGAHETTKARDRRNVSVAQDVGKACTC